MARAPAVRLARLAAPLEPKKPPYYVGVPVPVGLESTFPAAGWYWVPKEHAYAVFLGANFESAAVALYQLHHRAEASA